jgi:HSP20 family protein
MATLMRTDPFQELDRLTRQLFGTALRPAVVPMDAYRKGDEFIVAFDLPAVDPESIDLTVDGDELAVEAERKPVADGVQWTAAERPTGTFTRRLVLGENLDADKLTADYDAGVLTVRIPVAEQAKPRRIEIATSGSRKAISG